MELGIFSRTYECTDIDETFNRMCSDGLYSTHLNFANAGLATMPEEYNGDAVDRIATSVSAHGISMSSLTGTFNMIDPNPEQRRRGIEQFRLQCRLAKELKIPIVTLCTGSKNPESKWKWHNDNLLPESYADLMNTTESLLEFADEYDVILGVEPEVSNIINCPQAAVKYLKDAESSRLKIIMDGANLFTPEKAKHMRDVLDEAFDLLAGQIVLAHAKDFSLQNGMSFVAAGEGELDYEHYIGLLKESGYNGALLMHGLSEEQVSQSKRYLQQLL